MKIYEQEIPAGLCMECGARVGNGRTDRKFCSPECKNRYHNRESRRSLAGRRQVLSRLNRNYEILSGLIRLGLDSIGREEILLQGFSLDTFTSCRKVGHHSACCCFDILFDIYPSYIRHIRKACHQVKEKGRPTM